MTLKIQNGDLLEMAYNGDFDIIVHGCNCFHTMGGGIARQIREQFPQAYEADKKTEYGVDKTGTYSSVIVKNIDNERLIIINAYTQFNISSGEDVFSYDGFQKILDKLLRQVEVAAELGVSYRIGFPLIGCGLAGGDKDRILKMMKSFADKVSEVGSSVTLVIWG